MDFTLKAIEEMSFTYTEQRVIKILEKNNNVTLRYLGEHINVLYATLCKEIKKLIAKGIITLDETQINLTSFGNTIINYNIFKNKVLKDFCELNKFDQNTLESFILNKNYNNMKLLLGIKNLTRKKEF